MLVFINHPSVTDEACEEAVFELIVLLEALQNKA